MRISDDRHFHRNCAIAWTGMMVLPTAQDVYQILDPGFTLKRGTIAMTSRNPV